MHNPTPHPTINHITVQGKGHIQPGINHWIGVFRVKNNLLKGEPKKWKATVVHYEGPFDCRGVFTHGSGEAKIIHIRCQQKGEVIINIEGMGEPLLDDKGKIPDRPLTDFY